MANQNAGRNVMVQGRLVWTSGRSVFEGKVKTIFGTQTPRLDAKNEQMMEYGFGLAVPKAILGDCGPGRPGEIWAAMHAEAQTLFQGGQIPPSFAMKYKDGDGIDPDGKSYSQREGHAGHIILACTTSLPIKFFKWENNTNVLVSEGIKCGDYVNVQLSIKAHPAVGAGKAGLYLNPNAVQFLGYGKEIVNTPSGDQIFGNAMPAVPQGASVVPLAPQPGQLLVQPQAPAAPAMPQQPPQYAQPAQAPQAPPQPHFGVVPQQFQPPPGGMPMGNPGPVPMSPAAPWTAPAPVGAPPMGQPMAPPSFAVPVAPAYPSYPGMPQAPQGYPQ